MNIFVNTSNMQMSNLLSGFIGALLGALSSFAIAVYANKKAREDLKEERLRSHLAKAVSLAGQLIDNYISYNPILINQSNFGLQIEEKSITRINAAIYLHGEAKYLQYLLPEVLRHRWDMMLVLISEFSAMERIDSPKRNRAQVDVDHYIRYVQSSCVDFLDGRKVQNELKRPYLSREDVKPWSALDTD